MITDITLGQYIPKESFVHKLDPRIKIVLAIIYIVSVFIAKSILSYTLVGLFTFFCIFLSKINLKTVLKSLKPVLFLIIFTTLVNMFLMGGSDVLIEFYFIKITFQGLKAAVMMSLRLVFLVMGTSLLTYTTTPIQLTDGIEKLLSPLKVLKFPAHEIAMMMTIALRFIPTLLEETDKIIKAQKARGIDFESGNLIKRTRALIPILVPLFINSFRRADELAMAMECRCYRGGEGRTRLKQLKLSYNDLIAVLVIIMYCALVVILNFLKG